MCPRRVAARAGPVIRRAVAAAFLSLVAIGTVAETTAAVAAEPLSASDKTVYEQAFAAAERQDWTAALETASKAKNPVLRDVLVWQSMQLPSDDHSFEDIAAFVTRHPDWPGLFTLRRRADDAATGNEDPDLVVRWYEDHPPFTGRGKMLFAEALVAKGREARAREVVREAWVNEIFSRADERRFVARFGRYLDEELHRKRLDTLLWNGHAVSSRRMLRRVDNPFRTLAQARLALMTNRGGVDALIRRVPDALQDDPGLIYERVRWRRTHGLEETAADLLAHPSANQVDPSKWWRERAILARHFLEEGWVTQAYDIARDHGMESGVGFAEGEWLAGWIALRFLNEPERALRHFERLYAGVSYPISLARAAYWAGRSNDALHQPAAAKTWYGRAAEHITTYYGQLAAAHLGRTDPPALPDPPEPSEADRRTLERDTRAMIVRALHAIGQEDEARPFLWRLFEDAETPGVRRLVVELARDVNRLDVAVALSRRAALDGVHLIDTAYPLPRLELPDAPEEALILAVIRQESNFNSAAASGAGARGLMQLMPSTAKFVARKEKLKHTPAKLEDPEHNVRLGAAYLEGLLERFDGSYPLAVAAYNAGPNRPARWLEEYGDPRRGDLDIIDWVEMIPFSETRNYVQRVLEGLQVYRFRLGVGRLAMNPDDYSVN